jgi:hypothetical protein
MVASSGGAAPEALATVRRAAGDAEELRDGERLPRNHVRCSVASSGWQGLGHWGQVERGIGSGSRPVPRWDVCPASASERTTQISWVAVALGLIGKASVVAFAQS